MKVAVNQDELFGWSQHPTTTRQPAPKVLCLEQTRINRCASPPAVYYRAFWKRMGQLRGEDTETLQAWLHGLETEDLPPAQERQRNPAPGTTGPEWSAGQDKLDRLLAARDAIRETLRLRALAGTTYTPGRMRYGPTPETGPDPFADE